MSKKIYEILIAVLLISIVIIGIWLDSRENQYLEYGNLNIDNEKLNIFYLDVGQADSTLITMNGYTMLIDAGNDSDGYYITQFLKSQNISKIDYLVLTHFDSDHIGGAYKILDELDIGVLYMPGNLTETETYQKLLLSINENNINVDTTLEASNDNMYSLGNAKWKVLNINNGKDYNDSSIVVELYYGDTNYLFMGDASVNVENNNNINWDEIDVLKVGHHGSKFSTSKEFLNKINPTYAIISVGSDNGNNHPHSEVLERLNKHESIKEVYRTDRDNTIWVMCDGSEIEIEKIEYNLDGSGRKQAAIFRRERLAFFFSVNNMI